MFTIIFPLFADVVCVSPKEEIALAEKRLKHSDISQKGGIFLDLALAHLADQEMERALHYFVSALAACQTSSSYIMGEDEKKQYDAALSLYLQEGGNDPSQMAKKMIEHYESIALRNEEWHSLRMLIATAYANLDQMDHFFKLFYQSYPHGKESFLSYKTQGILYLRLSQVVKEDNERREAKREAMRLLRLALGKYQKDPTLYRVLIHFAKEEKREKEVLSLMEEMIQVKVMIPRTDLFSYVKEAVDMGELEAANHLIEYGRSLYEYSRGLMAAEEYVKQKKR